MTIQEKIDRIKAMVKSFKESQNAEALSEHERIEHLINKLSYDYDMPSSILTELRTLNTSIMTRFK